MANISVLDQGCADYQDKWTGFGALIDAVRAQIADLPPWQEWEIYGEGGGQIGVVTRDDFLRKLDNMHWRLTDRNYGALNGGVGAVVSDYEQGQYWLPEKWTGAREEINKEQFDRYLANGEAGACYLILHEIAHTTMLGLQTNNAQFKAYCDADGDPADGAKWAASHQWLLNEQIANEIAMVIARTLQRRELETCYGGLPCGIARHQLEFASVIDVDPSIRQA